MVDISASSGEGLHTTASTLLPPARADGNYTSPLLQFSLLTVTYFTSAKFHGRCFQALSSPIPQLPAMCVGCGGREDAGWEGEQEEL